MTKLPIPIQAQVQTADNTAERDAWACRKRTPSRLLFHVAAAGGYSGSCLSPSRQKEKKKTRRRRVVVNGDSVLFSTCPDEDTGTEEEAWRYLSIFHRQLSSMPASASR